MKLNRSVARGNENRSPTGKHPIEKIKATNDVYVQLLNALVCSIVGQWAPRLNSLEDLPRFCQAYEASASLVRECDTDLYFRYHQCACFLKKLELPLLRNAAKEPALAKWRDAEASCKDMNGKIWDMVSHPLTHSHGELQRVIDLVKAEIYPLLGEFPPDLDQVSCFMKFGPGATLSHSRDEGASIFKIINSSCYEGMEEEVLFLLRHSSFRHFMVEPDLVASLVNTTFEGDLQVEWHQAAKYDTVPKSTFEERTIEIGPSIATFIQQGYDGFLRQLLKREWGLDLRHQTPNKQLAFEGSIMGEKPNSPCTIDLSSASDRIAYGVVYALLPPSWVRTLSRYRAKTILLPDGTSHTLEKFSSMGNALTFSLQTLIFAAVVRSVLRERRCEGSRWRVYGDDIIVPFHVYNDVIMRLECLGFQVNQAKSFSRGFFRESCGGDYLHGTFVRPFYLKKPLRTVRDVCNLANNLAYHTTLVPIPASDFEPVYRLLLSLVPKALRCYGDTDVDPGNCFWTPQEFTSKQHYSECSKQRKAPEKLGYYATLLNGYTPPLTGKRSYVGGFLPTGLTLTRTGWGGRAEVLQSGLGAAIVPHKKPEVPCGTLGVILRRPRRGGYAARKMLREDLPFDPLLMD